MRGKSIKHVLLAVLLPIAAAASPAAGQQRSWAPGDLPPHAGPIRLGESLLELDATLGAPSKVSWPRPGRESRLYADRGISLIADSAAGVVWILLYTRQAGELAGIRVGDTKEVAEQRLGAPTMGRAETQKYTVGDWSLLVQLDPTVEFVYALSLGKSEFYPDADFGLMATFKRVVVDFYNAGESVGLLFFVSLANFILWRKYKYWVPRYVHILALVALLTICWLNWLWIQAGGFLTVRRVIIILFFPAIVYFFFVGYGGIRAALSHRARP